jgi:hypothetical protein
MELKHLKHLTTLDLYGTRVTKAGLKELQELKQLTWLFLGRTRVRYAAVKELQEVLPKCQISR